MNRLPCVCLVLIAFCTICFAGILGRNQKIKIKGSVFCPSNPKMAQNIQVKLMEEDKGFDDRMAETRTDSQGNFQIEGEESEITNIEGRLKLYHNCDDFKPCKRKWVMKIPDRYINKGVLDLGRWNLEMRLKDEDRDCI